MVVEKSEGKRGGSATPPYPKDISCYGLAFLSILMHPGNRVAAAMWYKPMSNRLSTQKFCSERKAQKGSPL